MDVDLPVFKSLPNVLDVEVVGQVVGVGMEAALNFSALLLCQERRPVERLVNALGNRDKQEKYSRCRIIRNAPVCGQTDNDTH